MTAPFFAMARPRLVGVAISETRLTVALPSSSATGRTREWLLTPMERADAEWPSLTAALAELRDALPTATDALAVALLPPLVQLRRVELPPKLRAGELRLLLSRNAARYLPNVREPQLAGGVALAQTTPAPYLVATAAARLVEGITRAAQQAGWQVGTIVPAQTAWTTAARHRWPALRDHDGDISVAVNAHVELLRLEDGQLVATRRLRAEDSAATGSVRTLDLPMEAAAIYAPEASGPELLPERVYTQRALARRRVLTRIGVVLAAVVVLASAGVLAHAHYVLHQVMAQRATLQAQADRVAKTRGDIASVTTPLDGLGHIETGAVRWSEVLADLTDVLPPDAHLTSFHARGDSLTVTGVAAHGADVFERMDGAKLIDDVRPVGPIRHEATPNEPPVDQFGLIARIPGATPLYATKPTRGKHS